MNYNDLVDVQFVDAVTHSISDTSDILGVVMPYHWGPAGKVNIFNEQEFYEEYPEVKSPHAVFDSAADEESYYETYFKVKSYFKNGGSLVAVWRPVQLLEIFGIPDTGIGYHIMFKYPGLPTIPGKLTLSAVAGSESGTLKVTFKAGDEVLEEFESQYTDPDGVDSDTGESTFLPSILEKRSQYLEMVDVETASDAPVPLPTDDDTTYTPQPPASISAELDSAFAGSDAIIPTQLINYTSDLSKYQTACFFIADDDSTPAPDRFMITVFGMEKIKVFNKWHKISCEAGVAGAYARVAQQVNLNQVASAKSYGTYNGVIVSKTTFQEVLTRSEQGGIVSVFTSNSGPQIFGVRNSYSVEKPGSYFGKCNVSRVLAAILRNVKPLAISAIHTATAADALLRAQFETNLQGIIDDFIADHNLQPDSKVICNETNNTDKQTKGGQILNIILQLHFIGLVERVKIKVVATDSSVTTEIV